MKKVIWILFIAGIFFSISASYAEETNDENSECLFNFKIINQYNSIDLDIAPGNRPLFEWDVPENTIWYESNIDGYYWGFEISYCNFGFKYMNYVSVDEADKKERVKSDNKDLNYYYYGKNYGIEVFYHKYKGFTIYDEDDEFYQPTEDSSFTERLDLKIKYTGINFYYIFSSDTFSIRASEIQTEKQLKSGGSFALLMTPSFFEVKSDYSLIPDELKDEFKSAENFKEGSFLTATFSIGYLYTLTFYNFFITPGIFIGAGPQYQHYNIDEDQKNDFNIAGSMLVKFSVGYNGDNICIGALFTGEGHDARCNDFALSVDRFSGEFYAGIKF